MYIMEGNLKRYRISEGRWLVTDGEHVFEVNNDIIDDSTAKDDSPKKIKRFILLSEKYYKSVKALSDIGVKTDYADPETLQYNIEKDKITVKDDDGGFDITKADNGQTVMLVKSGYSKDRIAYLLKESANMGVIVMNHPDAVNETSNKWVTYMMMSKAELPQPLSVLATSDDISKKDHSKLDKKLKQIYSHSKDDDRYVCKLLKGHGGHGVFFCRHKNILSILQCIFAVSPETKVLIQKKLDIKDGDLRVNVLTVNGKQDIVNIVRRTSSGEDFRTNLSLGGHSDAANIDSTQRKLAFAAAKASGLTWAGVDIIEDMNGDNYIIEVNGAPGTPFDVTDQEELLQKNIAFYADLVKKIDKLL